MNMSVAFNVFMRMAIYAQGMPFDVKDAPAGKMDLSRKPENAAREFITSVNAIDGGLREEDFAELESGKYKFRLDKALDL